MMADQAGGVPLSERNSVGLMRAYRNRAPGYEGRCNLFGEESSAGYRPGQIVRYETAGAPELDSAVETRVDGRVQDYPFHDVYADGFSAYDPAYRPDPVSWDLYDAEMGRNSKHVSRFSTNFEMMSIAEYHAQLNSETVLTNNAFAQAGWIYRLVCYVNTTIALYEANNFFMIPVFLYRIRDYLDDMFSGKAGSSGFIVRDEYVRLVENYVVAMRECLVEHGCTVPDRFSCLLSDHPTSPDLG